MFVEWNYYLHLCGSVGEREFFFSFRKNPPRRERSMEMILFMCLSIFMHGIPFEVASYKSFLHLFRVFFYFLTHSFTFFFWIVIYIFTQPYVFIFIFIITFVFLFFLSWSVLCSASFLLYLFFLFFFLSFISFSFQLRSVLRKLFFVSQRLCSSLWRVCLASKKFSSIVSFTA